MNVPPQIIKVKRRRDEDPVQALVVNKKIRGPTAGPESSSSWLSPGSTVYRLQRTEGKGGEVEAPEEGRLGIPIVRNTVAERATVAAPATAPPPAATIASLSVHTPTMGSATPTKRKGAPESPLAMTGVPGIDNTPTTPSPTQTIMPSMTAGAATRHGHPPGGKDNASLLQVPQPRKYHLAHRISHKRGPIPSSLVKRGTGSPKKSAVFMEGYEFGVGCPVNLGAGGAAGMHREKRRRGRKEELRVMLSRESLKEKEKAQAEAVPTPSTRKRPNVNPLEKKQNEERKKKFLGKTEAIESLPSENGMHVDTPKVPQQTKPVESSRGKDAHRHPVRDNIDNDDDELSQQLQAMVLAYLNDQDGITNLPTTPAATTRKKPGSRQQQLIGGGVGGGSWEKVDGPKGMRRSGSAISESDAGLTATEDESELSESEYVYDVYVKQTVGHKKLVSAAGAAVAGAAGSTVVDVESQITGMKPGEYGVLVISNSDDEEWFYEGAWEDEDKSEEEGLSDDEDSNAEDYHTNDYPDEEEVDEDFFGEDDIDEYIIGSDEVEGYLYSGLRGHRGNMVQSDDEGDSESESYEKIYDRSSQKWRSGVLGVRRKFAPGEEEYDLAEGSVSEDSDVGEVRRRRLERGVWGISSRSEGSDEEMD
ncbi:hypothetical protein EV426DRAFT_709766 [Tirmania nivea]|nr:hypothetical protein EV426DRAFT_709766 [Tirmania nivea]